LELTKEQQQQIETIKNDMTCLFDFKCEKPGFKTYPKIKLMGGLLECQEDDAENCGHSLPFGHIFLCNCPLMKYIRSLNSGINF